MRVHFDIGHPAHVHLFRNAIESLSADGHEVAVTSREKEVTTDLLDAYDVEHTVLSSRGEGTLDLLKEWSLREFKTIRFDLAFDPDVVVSRHVPPAVHAANLTGAGSVVFADTENVKAVTKLTAPLVDYWCTPESYRDDYGDRHVRHRGVQELAYLHPDRFEVDRELLHEHGVDPEERFFVLRFVSMGAHHDANREGIGPATRRRLVEALSERGTVYVSAEDELPPGADGNEIPLPPEEIHHLLAAADLMATDSGTMACEAAVLGTPTARLESTADHGEVGAFVELDERGLVRHETDAEAFVDRAVDLATDPAAGDEWVEKRDAYVADSTDVTGFMLDIIERAATDD